MVSLISSLFCDCSLYISVNGRLTEKVKVERGLLQGTVLSPLLFTAYIDPLCQQLNANSTEMDIESLFYADDIHLIHQSIKEIRNKAKRIDRWNSNNNTQANCSKSGITFVGNVRLDGNKVPHVTEYKYLGIPFRSSGIS